MKVGALPKTVSALKVICFAVSIVVAISFVQINILDKAVLVALVPTNTFNAPKLEKNLKVGRFLHPDIELFVVTANEVEVRVDILSPEVALKKKMSYKSCILRFKR